MKNSIKIGVFLDTQKVPVWIKRILESVHNLEFAEIQLVAYIQKPKEKHYKHSFFQYLHERLECYLFRNQIDYFRSIDVSEILEDLNTKIVVSDLGNSLNEIKSCKLDVILNFSSFSLNCTNLALARFGVWTCYLAHQNAVKESANIYWAVIKQAPVIHVDVICSNDGSGKKTIKHTSCLATNFNSLVLSKVPALMLFEVIILRLVNNIYISQHNILYERSLSQKEVQFVNGVIKHKPPTNWVALKNMLSIISHYLYQKLFRHQTTKWFLMYKFNSSPIPSELGEYISLMPGPDHFWADPFVLRENDKNYVFIEEFSYKERKGHITCLEVDASGRIINREKVLENSYHMSYPFIFDANETKYMIPETSQNNTIELYQCIEFPGKWTFVMNMMENVVAKDTTLFFHNQKWWMFTAIKETDKLSTHVELFLFYSDDYKTSNWQPHPLNPISTDIRCSRPAGKIFAHNNKIYRPSQDCSIRYGRALNICEITKLSETEYEEVLVSKFEADWHSNLKGVHTVNFDNNLSVMDAYCYE